MTIPSGLYVYLCIVPDVRKLYKGVPFDVEYDEGGSRFLKGDINKTITEDELDLEMKKVKTETSVYFVEEEV